MVSKNTNDNWGWWNMPIIPAIGRLKQDCHEFNLMYIAQGQSGLHKKTLHKQTNKNINEFQEAIEKQINSLRKTIHYK